MGEELLRIALSAANTTGVRYAAVRLYTRHRFEHLAVKNGVAESLTNSEESGIGVRVLREKGWGFASTTSLSSREVKEVGIRADRMARLAEETGYPIPFTLEKKLPKNGSYVTKVKEDPFLVPVEEKLQLLVEAERALHTSRAVKVGKAEYTAWQEEKHFLSTEGASYRSRITHVGAAITATSVRGSEMQRRSYPTSFGGDFAQRGFEFVRGMDLPAHAERVGKESVSLLDAPAAPSGTMNMVLASDQLALQVHESVGHATELDRVLAYEAGYAGTSFVRFDDVGVLRYGSPEMNIVADATLPGALGTFGWDDEGVPAQRTDLVKAGRHVGFLSSRETAARAGLKGSGGTMRGDGPLRMPLIRMTNVNLLPGDRTPEELFEEAREGIYLETNVSWSIDDKRLNFQFGCEVGRRIQGGKLGGLVRNPIYSGMTPAFWGSLAALGKKETWHMWGLPNCGKGQPGQAMHVGHGAPMGLFTDVRMGGTVG